MTSRNATAWSTMPSVVPGSGSPKTMIPAATVVMFAAVPVIAITLTASPSCRPRAEEKNAATEAAIVTNSHGLAAMPSRPSWPAMPVSALIATSRDAEQDAGRGAEHDAVVVGRGADARAHDQQPADAEQAGLEGDHRRRVEVGVRAVGSVRERHGQQDQAQAGEREAPPLPVADLDAEQALGHHADHHDAAGEDDLDDRDRRHRQRGDVEDPRARRDRHADGEPLRAVEVLRRLERVPDVDLRALAGSAVLEEEPEVRDEGADERQEDAELDRHEVVVVGRSGVGQAKRVPRQDPAHRSLAPDIGKPSEPLDPNGPRRA